MDILPPRQFAAEVVRVVYDGIRVVLLTAAILAVGLFLLGGIVGLCVIGWRAL